VSQCSHTTVAAIAPTFRSRPSLSGTPTGSPLGKRGHLPLLRIVERTVVADRFNDYQAGLTYLPCATGGFSTSECPKVSQKAIAAAQSEFFLLAGPRASSGPQVFARRSANIFPADLGFCRICGVCCVRCMYAS
jgi:hypothetical protein